MKWAYYVKEKMKAVIVFSIIITVILFSNIYGRKNFTDLDQSISSIYSDRLLPSTYIFELTDHLYRKEMLMAKFRLAPTAPLLQQIQQHDKAIATTIQHYEATYLTKEEQQQWATFKKQLTYYNNADSRAFDAMIGSLKALNQTQVKEGNSLQKHSHAIVSSSNLTSTFEISLLIVLALMSLVLLSTSDKILFTGNNQPHSLN